MTFRGTNQFPHNAVWPKKGEPLGFVSNSQEFFTAQSHIKGFNQYDWPNPQIPRRAEQDLRTWTFNDLSFIRSQSLIKPFNQSDWPNPQSRPFLPIDLRTQTYTSLPAGATPFHQTDWPNPQSRPIPLDEKTWIFDGTNFYYSTAVSIPFPQTDWPNPQSRPPSREPYNFSLDLLPFITSQSLIEPFSQTDWPNQQRYNAVSRATDLLTFIYTPQLLPSPGAPPFFQTDWPNPQSKPPSREPYSFSVDLLPFITSQGLVKPFSQTDWPNPQAPRRPEQDLRTFTFTLLPVHATPFNQTDWPNPQYKPFLPIDLRTFTLRSLGSAGTITVVLNTTDAKDTGNFQIYINQPAPATQYKPPPFQTGGSGVGGSNVQIPWGTAKSIVRRWYNAIGFQWLEEVNLDKLRPSERAFIMDTVREAPQIRYLLVNGYAMKEVYALIDIIKEENIDDDDAQALGLLD